MNSAIISVFRNKNSHVSRSGRNQMKLTCQYRLEPESNQKLILNQWLRTCRYWYNRMLGDRKDWWERNRCYINSCSLRDCHLPELRDNPNYFNQKAELPNLKKDLVIVKHSGEILDFSEVYSTVLQDVCKRVQLAFERYLKGDSSGKCSGKPRFKQASRYRTFNYPNADNFWLKFCTVNGKWLYIRLPGIGLVKVRTHRPIPTGVNIKQVSVTKKPDGWYIQLSLDDPTVPDFNLDELIPTWDNSMGVDAVLHSSVYLATSEGNQLPSLKPLRKNLEKLDRVSKKRNKAKKGSRSRRKLAKREGKIHQHIARSRKDFQYKTAHKLVKTSKKVFFVENLNLSRLTKRAKAKQDDTGKYLPNGASAKSGLNLSWNDAAFGQFFDILSYIAGKAGGKVEPKNPAYTSQLLSYKDEFVFTDCSIREYWDSELALWVDRDINAALNLKRVGLELFPTLKRSRGKITVKSSLTDSTSNLVLTVLQKASEAHTHS